MNLNPYFIQKGSLEYYLEVIFNEVVCKTLSSCLKIDFLEGGKKYFLKKVQEVRKYAGNVPKMLLH